MLLDSPPLAHAPGAGAEIAREQRAFRDELATQIPTPSRLALPARREWLLALASELRGRPTARARGRSRCPPGRQLRAAADVVAAADRRPALWGQALDTAGQGVKIGIIDSGIDPGAPVLRPGRVRDAGRLPEGPAAVHDARRSSWRACSRRRARRPRARGSRSPTTTRATARTSRASPRATRTRTPEDAASRASLRARISATTRSSSQTHSGLSPNANSPAIVAAIEAAVADGMDVINFSGGEPEIEPSRDIVALALDAAAAAGVVPVVAAGNDYNDLGAGSVSSPANSRARSASAQSTISGSPTTRTHAEFSSVGPTTISLRLKPDVAAPGVDVLSSVPGGGWAEFSGTSMAAPHIAGAAALLRQRHPAWTVEQLKSALVQSGADSTQSSGRAAGPRFQGGGVVALARADRPLALRAADRAVVRAARARRTATGTRALERRGRRSRHLGRSRVSSAAPPAACASLLPATVTVPGQLQIVVTVDRCARAGRPRRVRRAPPRRRDEADSALGAGHGGRRSRGTPPHACGSPGIYRSTTAGRPAVVSRYRYPEAPRGIGVTTTLVGPGARVPVPDREARRERGRRRSRSSGEGATSSRASSPGSTRTG